MLEAQGHDWTRYCDYDGCDEAAVWNDPSDGSFWWCEDHPRAYVAWRARYHRLAERLLHVREGNSPLLFLADAEGSAEPLGGESVG